MENAKLALRKLYKWLVLCSITYFFVCNSKFLEHITFLHGCGCYLAHLHAVFWLNSVLNHFQYCEERYNSLGTMGGKSMYKKIWYTAQKCQTATMLGFHYSEKVIQHWIGFAWNQTKTTLFRNRSVVLVHTWVRFSPAQTNDTFLRHEKATLE